MTVDSRSLVLEIEPRARMSAPATEAEIAEAERAVGSPFPSDLRTLLLQTNGIRDDETSWPIMPLGNVYSPAETSEPYGNGVVATTLSIRSREFAEGNDWDDEIVALLSTFVVISLDAAGAPFGFFAGGADSICVRYIEHDSGWLDEGTYSLEQYLRYYLGELASFED